MPSSINNVQHVTEIKPMFRIARFKSILFILFFTYQCESWSQTRRLELQTNKGCLYVEDVTSANINSRKGAVVEWTGSCKNGYVNGPGTLTATYTDGTLMNFKGTYLKGLENGQGRLFRKKGDTWLLSYEGGFNDGAFSGKGFLIDEAETHYLGNFINGQLSGQVFIKNTEGSIYNGGYENGNFEGLGVRQDADGESITGYWRSGKPYGMFIHTSVDKTITYLIFENNKVVYQSAPIYFSKISKKNPSNSKWDLVGIGSDGLIFLNRGSIKKIGALVKAWLLSDSRYKEDRLGKSMLSTAVHSEFDCARGAWRVTFENWYPLRQLEGQMIGQRNTEVIGHSDSQWQPAQPGTAIGDVLREVCK